VSINLTTPTQAGDYFSTWQPRTTEVHPCKILSFASKCRLKRPRPVSAATPVLTATATLRHQWRGPHGTSHALDQPDLRPGYNDLNGDGQQGADETLMAGVALTLADASGPRESYTTDGVSEPHCFNGSSTRHLSVDIKPPANYGSTTPDVMTINLSAGLKPNVMYGTRRSGLVAAPTRTASPSDEGAATGAASAAFSEPS